MCGRTQEINITEEQYKRWKAGEHLQDVAPNLTADEREILISGICGICFDKIFAE